MLNVVKRFHVDDARHTFPSGILWRVVSAVNSEARKQSQYLDPRQERKNIEEYFDDIVEDVHVTKQRDWMELSSVLDTDVFEEIELSVLDNDVFEEIGLSVLDNDVLEEIGFRIGVQRSSLLARSLGVFF